MFDLVHSVVRSGISNSTHFKVLIAIADCINSESLEWPISFADLQRLSRCGRRQMLEAVKELEQEGILIVKRMSDPKNPKNSLPNVYSIDQKILNGKYPTPSSERNQPLSSERNQPLVPKGTNPWFRKDTDISNDKEDISNTLSGERDKTPKVQNLFQNFENQGQQTGIPTKNESTPKAQKTSRKKKATPFPWDDKFPEELQDFKTNPKYATLIIEDEYEKFMNYYKSHGKPMADWRRAFISWLLKAKEFQQERVLNKTQQKPRKVPQKENFNEPGRWDGFVGADGTML